MKQMVLKEQHKVQNLNVCIITKKVGVAQVWIKKIDETIKTDMGTTLKVGFTDFLKESSPYRQAYNRTNNPSCNKFREPVYLCNYTKTNV